MTFRAAFALSALLSLFFPAMANARDIQVQMKTSGADGMMVFEPSYIRAEPGDRITFLPTQPSHNAESIAAIMPAGAAPFKGAIDRPVVLTVTRPGLYGVKCLPHFGMGMVALVQVGKVNRAELDAAKAVKLPGLAAKRMAASLAKVK